MATSNPVIWLPGAVISHLRFYSLQGFQSSKSTAWKTLGMAAYWLVYASAMMWLKNITDIVPEPYLDEVFHIPQSQLYCNGVFDYWDPKLTTPPGLYIFATIFSKLRGSCSVFDLRLFNVTILPVTMLIALSCRHFIRTSKAGRSVPSADTIHTALNISLSPPLFFFSGLFYTDLLSTCVVLGTYWLYLKGGHARVLTYPAGLLALSMRQTNIFWVAIFLGGLEVVRTVKYRPITKKEDTIVPRELYDRVQFELERWARGDIHDVSLDTAGVHDYVFCVLSLVVAALYQPGRVTLRLSPYVGLLITFGAFVYWNGSVVLGDKSNHVATIHLPQILYLFAFTGFFSLPLIVTPTLNFLRSLVALLQLPIFPRLKWQYLLAVIYTGSALVGTLFIIKYNTIIHPFTLADNRHYVFYVFRYTILRHPLIRYLLAPIYLACAWATYLALCSSSVAPSTILKSPKTESKPEMASGSSKTKLKLPTALKDSNEGPKTAFLIIFMLTTALSLITAPLVEPRYFIIPWVIWRLHIAPLQTKNTPAKQGKPSSTAQIGIFETLKYWAYQGYDYRLWLETAYFLAINAVTGYVFLYKGFTWPQEPGKVQRFMW